MEKDTSRINNTEFASNISGTSWLKNALSVGTLASLASLAVVFDDSTPKYITPVPESASTASHRLNRYPARFWAVFRCRTLIYLLRNRPEVVAQGTRYTRMIGVIPQHNLFLNGGNPIVPSARLAVDNAQRIVRFFANCSAVKK